MCKYRIFWRNSRDIHSNFAANHLYSGLFLEKSWKIAVKVVFLWSICASNVRQMCVKCASKSANTASISSTGSLLGDIAR